MARVLITGMTAPQTSSSLHSKTLSFAGAIKDALSLTGHNVDIANPSIHHTASSLRSYDSIVIGVAPLLSVTSNKAYGAMKMIDLLSDDDRLTLMIDTTEPVRISANLRAAKKDFSCLLKKFYTLRKFYEDLAINENLQDSVKRSIDLLCEKSWPATIYPAMPWASSNEMAGKLPDGAKGSLRGVYVDSIYLKPSMPRIDSTRAKQWVIDNQKTRWSKNVVNTLAVPHVEMKVGRFTSDAKIYEHIASSLGAIISPTDDGLLPWSARWSQALNSNTPIATDWRIASKIGSSWSHLAAGIEEMSYIDRYELSVAQKEEYSDSLPSRDIVIHTLKDTLRI